MADLDKVIKGLELCLGSIDSAGCPEECPYYEACQKYENLVVFQPLMRDALEALKAQEWISVKDKLPESAGLKVLVAAKSDESVIQTMAVFTAFLGYGDWKWYTQDVGFMKNAKLHDNEIHPCWTITHWMLPPEPPKEE